MPIYSNYFVTAALRKKKLSSGIFFNIGYSKELLLESKLIFDFSSRAFYIQAVFLEELRN